jgi:hypothetical protein
MPNGVQKVKSESPDFPALTEPALAVHSRLHRVRARLRGVLRAPTPRTPARPKRNPRTAVCWFVALTLFVHIVALILLDSPWPNLRDPEYGMRLSRLRTQQHAHPLRPVAVVVGTSRASMGVKPDAWETQLARDSHEPLLFNFSTVGAGPIQQLITVRRLYADGITPALVLLEYWPPVMRQDGRYDEQDRIDRRLRYDDWPVVRDYFPDPERARNMMLETRLNPIYANRDRWMVRIRPTWLAPHLRADITWREMDAWGWLPGLDVKPHDATTRQKFLDHYRDDFRTRFDGYTIHPNSDRALREAVAVARAHGSRVGFVYLPESREVREWYPASVEATARAHLATLAAELRVPVIHARDWMDDCYLADGHHLSRTGAGVFTQRFGDAIANEFFAQGAQP